MAHRFAAVSSRVTAIGIVLALLTACGGGGGGGGFLPNNQTNPLSISTASLPEVISTPYSTVLEAGGGAEPYAWTLEDDGGTGFTLNSEGILRGETPPPAGSYGLTFSVTDAAGRSARQSLNLVVSAANALVIETTALPEAVQGLDYTALLDATGGQEPYTWNLVNDGGTGFRVDNAGVLTGTAPSGGNYGITVSVTDAAEGEDRASFILTTTGDAQQPLSIATTSLPSTEADQVYSAILQANGGKGDYLWTLVDDGGTGLDLRDDGVLSGTAPSEEGSYAITVSVSDDVSEVTSGLILSVTEDSDPLSITTGSLPGSTEAQRYAAVLEASGGTGSYSWQLISSGGSGLSLSADGVLSGTTFSVGSFGIVFRVSDGSATKQGALTLEVAASEPSEPLSITSETLPPANSTIYAAALAAEGGVPPYSWTLVNDGGSGLSLSSSGSLSGTTPAPGTYGITVSVADVAGGTATAALTLEVTGSDAPPVSIITTDLGTATAGESYSFVLRASGGQSGDYAWRLLELLPATTEFPIDPNSPIPDGVIFWPADDIDACADGDNDGQTDFLVTVQVNDNGTPPSVDTASVPLTALDPNTVNGSPPINGNCPP